MTKKKDNEEFEQDDIKQENLDKKAAYKWAKEEKIDPDLFLYWGKNLMTYNEYEKVKNKMTGRK